MDKMTPLNTENKTKKNLEYELRIREGELEMLNNTLIEMFARNSITPLVDRVQLEVTDKLKEISKIKEQLNSLKKKEVSFDNKGDNIYDSVKKEKKLTYDEVYKNKPEKNLANIREKIDKMSLDDNYMHNNLFLCDLSDIKIPSEKVKSVFFDVRSRKVIIKVYDFLAKVVSWDETCCDMVPIISVIESSKAQELKFDFSIEHINPSGVGGYVEKYSGARITTIYRDDLSYENDDLSTISIEIAYKDVSYETSK